MMDEQFFSEFPKEFSETLLDYCEAPAPRPDFIVGLEGQLLERQSLLLAAERSRQTGFQDRWAKFSALFARRRWQYAALLLLAALTIALFAIGPQRVLAQMQRWLGYVPGIGFVNLAETQVLASPIETTREGITLRVEQVIAGPENTQVLISSPGLSEKDLPWPNKALENPDFSAFLILPDGSRMEMKKWELSIGTGKLEFPALPTGVHQVTLVVPGLPLVPHGVLPENWEIPLSLRPANGELNQALFPQPYSPQDASDSHHGISLRVLDVAQTPEQTALHYRVEWSDPDWEFRFGLGSARLPELRDDLGHIYWQSPGASNSSVAVVAIPKAKDSQAAPTPSSTSYDGTLVFPDLSLSASQGTLWVDALEFQVPVEGSFTLDLGKNPQVGEALALDANLEVEGFPVHLHGTRLRQETVDTGDDRSKQRTVLEFSMDPPAERDGFSLNRFSFTNGDRTIYGSAGMSFSNGEKVYKGELEFTTGKVPAGKIELELIDASLLAQGPWEASWAIPGRDSSKAALPVQLFPQAANPNQPEGELQPEAKMQPVVEEAFLSDRLTAIKLDAVGLPPGASFVQALPYDPVYFDPNHRKVDLYLQDNWGRRYDPGRNEAFIRPEGEEAGLNPGWMFFPPLQPLAQNLTLHVPGMEVFKPGEASFDIQVPQDVSFKPQETTVTVIGGGGPERQITETMWVSDFWPVDISLDLAGHQLHFTQARIERDEQSDTPYTLQLMSDPFAVDQGESHLIGLRFVKVAMPDGKTIRIDPALQNSGMISLPYGGVGPLEPGSSQVQAGVGLGVTAADGADLLSGSYHVELNGVTEWVPGPWELSFSLSGN